MNLQQTLSKHSTRSTENRTGRFKDVLSNNSKKISNKSLKSASFCEELVSFSPLSDITEISEENLTEDATTFLLEKPASVTSLQPEKIIYTTELSSTDYIDAGLQYKKLKDEIIEYVLQELNHNLQSEDRSHTQSQVVLWEKPFLFLCGIILFIGAVLFLTPDVDSGLVPT